MLAETHFLDAPYGARTCILSQYLVAYANSTAGGLLLVLTALLSTISMCNTEE